MFAQAVNEHLLLGEDANEFFKIYQYGTAPDQSALATLRALAAPRMKAGEELCFQFQSVGVRFNGSETESSIVDRILSAVDFATDDDPPRLSVINLSRCTSDADFKTKIFDALLKLAPSKLPGEYAYLDKITVFYKKAFPALCFVDVANKRSVMFVAMDGLRAFHYLQCCFAAALPWIFDESNKIQSGTDERELVESLREKLADRYLALLDKFAEKYNFAEMRIKRLLDGFETRHVRSSIENERRRVANLENEIQRYMSAVMEKISERETAESMLMGLSEKLKKQSAEPSALEQYFLRNKAVELESCTDTHLIFSVYTDCQYFNQDEAKRVITNDDSAVYDENHLDHENFKKLLTAIFLDRKLTLRFFARYDIDMRGGVSGLQDGTINRPGYMYNPHIRGFACMGENTGSVNELLRAQRYISAIDQCIASAAGLAFTDYTVINEFGDKLSSTNRKCIILPDGRSVTPSEAIEYLNEEAA